MSFSPATKTIFEYYFISDNHKRIGGINIYDKYSIFFIEPSEKSSVNLKIERNEENIKLNLKIRIIFEDIFGNKYYQEMETGESTKSEYLPLCGPELIEST